MTMTLDKPFTWIRTPSIDERIVGVTEIATAVFEGEISRTTGLRFLRPYDRRLAKGTRNALLTALLDELRREQDIEDLLIDPDGGTREQLALGAGDLVFAAAHKLIGDTK